MLRRIGSREAYAPALCQASDPSDPSDRPRENCRLCAKCAHDMGYEEFGR